VRNPTHVGFLAILTGQALLFGSSGLVEYAAVHVKIAYRFARRGIAKLTGRETERMIEPLQMYAHVPKLFKGYAKLEQATAKLGRLDKRLHALAELKAALVPGQILSNPDDDLPGRPAGWRLGKAAVRAVQVMRASTVIASIARDWVTYDAEMDSRKPNRPTVRLMSRAPSVEAV
jgi:hypothetical protein